MFVALGIQHAMHMRLIVMVCLTLQHFPRYLINGTIFEKKLLSAKCILLSSNFRLKHFSLYEEPERDMIKKFILVFM